MVSSKTNTGNGVVSSAWDGCYPTNQASRLTGVPKSTLNKWKRDGLICPDAEAYSLFDLSDRPSKVGYGLTDLMVMKLLRALRNKRIDRKMLADTIRQLILDSGGVNSDTWRHAPIYISGGKAYSQEPDGWKGVEGSTDTNAAGRMVATAYDLFGKDALFLIPERYRHDVEIAPEMMGGEPVVAGTRVPTSLLAAMHRQGNSLSEIASSYTGIPQDTIEKAVEYERWLNGAIHIAA